MLKRFVTSAGLVVLLSLPLVLLPFPAPTRWELPPGDYEVQPETSLSAETACNLRQQSQGPWC